MLAPLYVLLYTLCFLFFIIAMIATETDDDNIAVGFGLAAIIILIGSIGTNIFFVYKDSYHPKYEDKTIVSITKQENNKYAIVTSDGSDYTFRFNSEKPEDVNIVKEERRVRIYNYYLKGREYELFITAEAAKVFDYEFKYVYTA